MPRYVYQVEGSLSPGSPWITPADGGRYETRAAALAALPRYHVPGLGLGLRVRRVNLEKEQAAALPRRQVSHVRAAAPVLRKAAR
jgi:hypothetical protein